MKQYFNFKRSLNKPFHWVNNYTGEIVPHIWNVIYGVIHDMIYYRTIKSYFFQWSYSFKGI